MVSNIAWHLAIETKQAEAYGQEETLDLPIPIAVRVRVRSRGRPSKIYIGLDSGEMQVKNDAQDKLYQSTNLRCVIRTLCTKGCHRVQCWLPLHAACVSVSE